MAASKRRSSGGRPKKFDGPSRPVTMTLPERTLARLAAIDADRASAVVKLVDAGLGDGKRAHPRVEVVEVASGSAIIVLPPSRTLRELPWLQLAEIAPGRHLLTIEPGTSIEALEVALLDLIEELPADDEYERRILVELRRLIGASRRGRNIRKFEMLYVRPPEARRRRVAAG